MIKEIKLNKPYRAKKHFDLFPKYVILLRKSEVVLSEDRYFYYDLQRGEDGKYLTHRDLNLAYEEMDDEYF